MCVSVAQGGFEEAALLVGWKYALYRSHGGLRIQGPDDAVAGVVGHA
jgi:hypothetical protein